MHKRKNIGILKYGKVLSKRPSVRKFQEGGTAHVVSGYDWRDDPYELMLMKQEQQGTSGKTKRSSSGGGGSGKLPAANIKGFDVLTGGLDGTRRALNSQYKQLQDQFYTAIKSNSTQWLNTDQGKLAFQQIVTFGKEAQEVLNSEKEEFDNATKDLSETDLSALAISEDQQMMVLDKDAKKYDFIPMKTYLKNIDGYTPLKVSHFIEWKKKYDTSGAQGDTSNIHRFLVNSAVSPQKVTELYVKPNIASLSYIQENGLIVPNNANKTKLDSQAAMADPDQWSKTIEAALLNTSAKGVSENTQDGILTAAKTLYGEIFDRSGNANKLRSSLYSEVLSNTRHTEAMASLSTEKERYGYLEKQARLTLINKLYGKGGADSAGDDGALGGDTDGKANLLIGAFQDLTDGNKVKDYVFGSDFTGEEGKEKRIGDVSTPMITIASSYDLGLVTDPDSKESKEVNKIGENPTVNTYFDTSQVYLPTGLNLNKKLTNDGAAEFMDQNVRIAPGSKLTMVGVLMDGEGNMTMHEVNKISRYLVNVKQKFLDSFNTMAQFDPRMKAFPTTLRGKDIVEGVSSEEGRRALTEYNKWIEDSKDVDKLTAQLNKNPNDKELKVRKLMAESAANAVNETQVFLRGLETKKIEPLGKMTVIVDNDGDVDLYDLNEEHVKATGYGDTTIFKPVRGGIVGDYMQKINAVDNFNVWEDWNKVGLWPGDDNYYKTNLLFPLQSLGRIASMQGEKVSRIPGYKNIDNQLRTLINRNNALSNPGSTEAVIDLLKD